MSTYRMNWIKVFSMVLSLAMISETFTYAAPVMGGLQDHPVMTITGIPLDIHESIASVEDLYNSGGLVLGGTQPVNRSVAKLVYLVQDAHTNSSAQLNTSKTLEWLFKKKKGALKYIFLEAGAGDESLSGLRQYSDLESRRRVARSYLAQGQLQGSEYFNLTTEEDAVLFGVEDMNLYLKSLEVYRAAARERDKFYTYLDKTLSSVNKLKRSFFNPLLFSFDEKYQKYQEGSLSLTDYYEALTLQSRSLGISLRDYPGLRGLERLRRLETRIDFSKANTEQARAWELLDTEKRDAFGTVSKQARKASGAAGGDTDESAFLTYLEESLGSKIKQYPNLSRYIDYRKLAHELLKKSVLDEEKRLGKQVFGALCVNADEESLVKAAESIDALKKLLRLSLVPDEFDDYRKDNAEFDIRRISGFINEKIMNLRDYYGDTVFLEPGFEAMVKKCEEFYRLTWQRDTFFVKKMLAQMDRAGQNQAVLVTGGYHTPNLKRLLKQQGISYVCLAPRVYQETDQKRYEKLLLGQNLKNIRQFTEKASALLSEVKSKSSGADTMMAARLASCDPWGNRDAFFDALCVNAVPAKLTGQGRAQSAKRAVNQAGARLAGDSASSGKRQAVKQYRNPNAAVGAKLADSRRFLTVASKENFGLEAAKQISAQIRLFQQENPKRVVNMLMGRGGTMAPVYAALAPILNDMAGKGEIEFSRIQWFQAYEHAGPWLSIAGPNDWFSVAHFMNENLFKKLSLANGFNMSQVHWMADSKSPAAYLQSLKDAGGADIADAVMASDKGDFWMLPPGTSPDLEIADVRIASDIIDSLGKSGHGTLPRDSQTGITFGLKTALSAKVVFFLANGPKKNTALKAFVQSEPAVNFPASFLKKRANPTVCIFDQDAAQGIDMSNFALAIDQVIKRMRNYDSDAYFNSEAIKSDLNQIRDEFTAGGSEVYPASIYEDIQAIFRTMPDGFIQHNQQAIRELIMALYNANTPQSLRALKAIVWVKYDTLAKCLPDLSHQFDVAGSFECEFIDVVSTASVFCDGSYGTLYVSTDQLGHKIVTITYQGRSYSYVNLALKNIEIIRLTEEEIRERRSQKYAEELARLNYEPAYPGDTYDRYMSTARLAAFQRTDVSGQRPDAPLSAIRQPLSQIQTKDAGAKLAQNGVPAIQKITASTRLYKGDVIRGLRQGSENTDFVVLDEVYDPANPLAADVIHVQAVNATTKTSTGDPVTVQKSAVYQSDTDSITLSRGIWISENNNALLTPTLEHPYSSNETLAGHLRSFQRSGIVPGYIQIVEREDHFYLRWMPGVAGIDTQHSYELDYQRAQDALDQIHRMQEAYETTHALTPEQIKYLQLARKKTDTPRKVVFIAMENHWHGVGGERDYVRDFSSALAQRGHQSFVFSVNYGRKTLNGDEVVITGLEIPVYDGHLTVDVIKREIRLQDGSVVTNYLLQASEKTPMIFEKIYKEQGSIRGAVEAVLLSKASFLICKQLNMHPDILFANDWQAGLANAYLNNEYVDEPLFKNTSSLFITHNISYQGVFDGYHVADPVIADEKGQSILTARGELNPTHPKYQLLVSGGVTKDDLFRLWSDRDQKEYIHIRLLKRNDRGLQVFEPADPDGYVRMLLATGVLKLNSTASLNNEGHSIMELAPVNDRDDSTHNLWGLPQSVVRRTGTPGFEYFAQAKTGAKGSLLKVGAGSSDTTVAVAPHTLEETFTPEKGAGMDGVMRRKKHEDAAQAVYNGCNVTPEVTEHIQSGGYEPVEANETATTLVRKKRINKINLYNQLRHLEVDNKDIREVFNLETLCGSAENFQEALTVVMMARFTEQKGFQDINEDFLRRLKAKGIKLVIFGDGDPATRESLKALAQNPEFGETFGLIIGYSETYADHFFNSFDVYAGHSLWEPAGIAQQKANIFGGTVAVLSNVGGHKSFVQDGGSAITYEMPLDQKQRRENWIRALETAADIKHNRPYAWREMMLKAQRFRFIADWRVRSAQYEKIFDKVLSRPRLANRHFVQFMDRLASRNIRFINEPADLYVLASLNERQLNPLAGYLIKDHGQTINNVDIDASMTAQDVADWVDGNFSSFVVQLKIEGTTLKVRKVQSGLPLSQAVSAARLAAKTNYVFSEKEGAFAQNTAWLIADAIAKRQNEKSPTSVVNVLLPTGSTVAAMYPLLAKRIGELATSRKLDPSRIHWYQAYEYKGIQKNDERSKAHYLKVNFFDYLQGVGEAQIHYIEEKSIDEYARSLAAQGGADIAIAAMGDDGHFWMVKPGSDMTASVLIRELDGGMKRGQNFNDLNDQDGKAYGITLGPVVMQKAHQVILVGSGISKKGIADRILKGLTISVDLLPSEWLYRLVQSQMILERTLAPDKFRTPDFNLLPGQSVIFHRDDLGEQGRMVSLSDNYKDGSVVIRAEAKSVYLDTHPLKVDTDSQSKAILTWPKNEEFLIVHGKPSRFGYTDSADIQKPSLNVEVLSGGEYVAVTNASSLNLLCHKVAEPMNGARLANNRRMEVGTGSNLLGMIEQMFELQKKEEGYFKIWDDGRNIKYIVLTRDGKRHVFTDYNEVLRLKETGNILCYGIVNPVRATRAGASSTVRIADNDPKAHAIDFDKIRDQYTNEYYIEWTSSASREWVLTFNLNASFPPIKDADPQAQPLYLTISRKDKTPQADMKNQENLEDMIELLILLDKENKSVKDKAESYRLLINGWYYSNNQEATSGGATQNQAHAQGMRRFLPIESESVTSLGRNGNVEIGLIDSKGYSPAIALTGDDDSWRQLAKIQARLLEGIIKTDTGRSAGDKMSFDISLAPAGGGRYRLVTFPRGRTLSTSDQAPLIGALGLVGVLEGLNEQAADQFTSNYYLNTTSELCASLVVVERFASQLTGGGDGARLVAGSQAGSLPNNAIEAIKLRPAGLPPAVVSARVAPPEDLAQLIKHSASAKNPAPVGARAAQFEGIQKGDYVSFVYKYWSAKAPLYGFVTYISRGYITIKGNDGKSYDFGPEISKYLTVSVAQSRADREWDEDHDANRKYRMGTYVPRDGEHGYGARLSRQTSVARVRAVSLPIRPQVPFRPALNHRLGAGQTRCHARYVEFAIQTMTTGQSGTLMVGEAELEFGIVVDTAGKKVLMIGGMGAGPVVIRDYRLSLRAVQRRLGMLQVSRTELLKQLGSQENEQRTKIWAAVGQSLKQLAGSPAVIELHLNGFNNADFRCVDAPELSRLLRILSKRNVLTVLKGRPEVINVLISQARHDYPEATFLYRDPKSLPDSHAKAPVAAIAAGKEDIMSIPSGCFRVGHEAVTRNSLTRYQSLLLIAELEAKMQTTGNRYFYKEHLRGAYQAIGIDVSDEKEWWEVISGNNTKWDIVQRYLARLRAIPMGAKLSLAARLARQIASMA